ncbi:hypothetical protein FJ364_02985 [Candidatus Dependentiae bacterium]|nr:hypothetical protein [Candidatus Dependentiae bacterium]
MKNYINFFLFLSMVSSSLLLAGPKVKSKKSKNDEQMVSAGGGVVRTEEVAQPLTLNQIRKKLEEIKQSLNNIKQHTRQNEQMFRKLSSELQPILQALVISEELGVIKESVQEIIGDIDFTQIDDSQVGTLVGATDSLLALSWGEEVDVATAANDNDNNDKGDLVVEIGSEHSSRSNSISVELSIPASPETMQLKKSATKDDETDDKVEELTNQFKLWDPYEDDSRPESPRSLRKYLQTKLDGSSSKNVVDSIMREPDVETLMQVLFAWLESISLGEDGVIFNGRDAIVAKAREKFVASYNEIEDAKVICKWMIEELLKLNWGKEGVEQHIEQHIEQQKEERAFEDLFDRLTLEEGSTIEAIHCSRAAQTMGIALVLVCVYLALQDICLECSYQEL